MSRIDENIPQRRRSHNRENGSVSTKTYFVNLGCDVLHV